MNLLEHLRSLRRMSFVRDVFTMQWGVGIYAVLAFVASILYARFLGVNGFGEYAVVLAFVGTAATLLQFGQSSSLLVFFAEELGKGNRRAMAAVVRNYLHVSFVNACVLLVCAIFAPQLSKMFYGSETVGMYARVLFLYSAVDAGNGMVLIILQAMRKIQLKVFLEQAQNCLTVITAISALLLGFGILGIVSSSLFVSLVFLIINPIMLRRAAKDTNLPSIKELRAVKWSETRGYLGQGLLMSVEKNIGNLFPQGLYFLMSLVAPQAAVGLARIAVQISHLGRTFLFGPIGDVSLTVLAKQRAQGAAALKKNGLRVIRHTVAIHAAIGVVIMAAAPLIIRLLYGTHYAAASYMVLWLVPFSVCSAVCITNAPLLRLFRKTQVSIVQASISWLVVLGIFSMRETFLTPNQWFALSYAIIQALPVTVTWYLYSQVLRREVTSPLAS